MNKEMLRRVQALLQPAGRSGGDLPRSRVERPHAADGEPSTAVVYLYSPIGGWFGVPASTLVPAIDALDVDVIEVRINSPGGDAFDGFAIHSALARHSARVVARVDGLAASAASLIACGADEVVMSPVAQLMIHKAWGVCVGNSDEMAKSIEVLDRVDDAQTLIYSRRAGGDRADWLAAMAAETWYSAQEAVDAGLADRVDGADEEDSEDESAAAAWDLSVFAFAGRSAAPAPWSPQSSAAPAADVTPRDQASGDTHEEELMTEEQIAALRQMLGVAADADVDTILAALQEALQERADSGPAPDGTVLVDEATMAGLRADAAAGRQARDQQQQERRESLVLAAMRDGRIPAARREHWIEALTVDPEGSEAALARLQPGLVPVEEQGHDSPEARSQTDAYDALYGAAPKEG